MFSYVSAETDLMKDKKSNVASGAIRAERTKRSIVRSVSMTMFRGGYNDAVS